MKKGDGLTLIPIEDGFMPGRKLRVVVQDHKDATITVASQESMPCVSVIVQEMAHAYWLRECLTSVRHDDGETSPAIMQLEEDNITNSLLDDENIKPVFNRDKLLYEYGVSEKVLDKWVKIGVLACDTVDFYHACPECYAVLSVRKGCRKCMSRRVGERCRDILIRHIACGYIGHGHQFDDWRCPSCRAKVVEGGFERLQPPMKCDDCGFLNNSQPHYVGTCLACCGSFHLHDSLEVPVFSYSRRPTY